jgi:STE24 endopeptidase
MTGQNNTNDPSCSEENLATDSPVLAGEMTGAELNEAREYGRKGLRLSLLDRSVDLVYLGLAAFLLAVPLNNWFMGCPFLNQYATVRLIILFTVIFGLHTIVSFPISIASGHFLEHRYGLSNQSIGRWFWSYTKRMVLGWAFSAALFTGLFWLIWLVGGYWWLVAAGAFFVVSVILGQLMPVLILPLFYKVEKLDDPDLAERFDKLVEGTGLAIEGTYRINLSKETVKANAMLAGLGSTRRVLLGDTLLKICSHEETEVIFAHEVGHHVFRHIRKMILTGLIASLLGFWICNWALGLWVGQPLDYANLPVYCLPLLMFVLTVFAQLLEPIQNTLSRHYERQSDQYALDRTQNPEAYISAFEKLARLNKSDPDPHPLEVFLFHNHPPIKQRVWVAKKP